MSLLLASACGSDVIWNNTVPLPDAGWNNLHSIEFHFLPEDSMMLHKYSSGEVILYIRYNRDCRDRVIQLLLEQESLSSALQSDTLTVQLFDENGEPYGEGLIGVYEKNINLGRLPLREGMRIAVTPISSKPLKGLTSATLIIHR